MDETQKKRRKDVILDEETANLLLEAKLKMMEKDINLKTTSNSAINYVLKVFLGYREK